MEMKKIISALVLGAAAAGIATADLSINLNAKVASNMYTYNTGNAGGKGLKQKQFFNLGWGDNINGKSQYAAPQDNVTLKASGNIFTFTSVFQPIVDDNDVRFKAATIAAKLGNFTFTTGWHRDGISVLSFNSNINGADEGKLTGGMYKLGGGFGGPAAFVNNQAGIGKDQATYFAHAKYGLSLGDAFTLNLAASLMSPHGFENSQEQNVNKDHNVMTGNNTKNGDGTFRNDDTGIAWGLFVNPVIKNIVSIDVIAKGWDDAGTDRTNLLFGAYANLLCVPVMNTALIGGSVYLHDIGHYHLEEWNIDLSLGLKLGDRIALTFNNKFAAAPASKKDAPGILSGKTVGSAIAINSESYTNEYMLWDVLGVSFKLNDTFTFIGTVGQQSAFGSDGEKGTTIFVYPHAQIFAARNASVTAGAVLTLDKLGYNIGVGDAKKMAIRVDVPVVVKVAL